MSRHRAPGQHPELAFCRLADHKIADVWVTADNLHAIDQLRCDVR